MNFPLEKLISRLAETAETPSPAVKEAVMAHVRANGFSRRGYFAWKLAGGGAFLALVMGGSLVAASQSAPPGHALYGMKLASESAYAKSQMSAQARADAAESLIERRLAEARALDEEAYSDESDEAWSLALAEASEGWVNAQENLFVLALSHD